MVTLLLLSALGGLTSGCAAPQDPGPLPNESPPMGWNSWNSGIELTEQSIKATIDAMISSGMRDAGYRYVNLDAGWAAPRRGWNGHLDADPDRFPGGIAVLSRYAHDRGMFLGLYSSPYNEICGQGPANGSAGHETTDAKTFAAWGIDYLKYDWCRIDATHTDQVRVFTAMRDALRASGRRVLYSINPNSSEDPTAGSRYDWTGIADMTRNTVDLFPLWRNGSAAADTVGSSSLDMYSVPAEFEAAAPVAARSRPRHWNDPDMLVVGLTWADFVKGHPSMLPTLASPGSLTPEQLMQAYQPPPLSPELVALVGPQRPSLSDTEQRAHFSLWAMLAAPLIAGNDVRTMSEQTRAILTNREVIAVDQDPLVAQGAPTRTDSRVIVKPLADGAAAVALFNPGDRPVGIETSTTVLGLEQARCYTVRNLWTHSDSTTTGIVGSSSVPAHGVDLLRISPRCQ
jgi:alpha-galactosidase